MKRDLPLYLWQFRPSYSWVHGKTQNAARQVEGFLSHISPPLDNKPVATASASVDAQM